MLKERKKITRTCVSRKRKIVIFAAPLIYFNFTVDDWLKTFNLRYIKLYIRCIWHINVNLHRILFNLFLLTVNLNLYCSWKTLRLEQIVCVAFAWSPWIMVIAAFAQNGYKLWQKKHFQHESSVFGPRLPRGLSKFSN